MPETEETEAQEPEDFVTLEAKEPPPIVYGQRRQAYPYEEAAALLLGTPGQWLSLRVGPSNRMDQFRTRFRKFALEYLPEQWELESVTRSLPEQDSLKYEQRQVEVFARAYPVTV